MRGVSLELQQRLAGVGPRTLDIMYGFARLDRAHIDDAIEHSDLWGRFRPNCSCANASHVALTLGQDDVEQRLELHFSTNQGVEGAVSLKIV